MKNGYTMIEILIVLAIFTILLGVTIANIRGVSGSDRIKSDTDKITAVLRQARNRAFNGIVNPKTGVFPTGGWGLYLDNGVTPRQYILFADTDGDGVYDSGEEVNRYTLSANVNIAFRNANAGTFTKGTIIFKSESFPKLLNVDCDTSVIACVPTWSQHSSNVIFQIRQTGLSCIGSVKFAPPSNDSSLRIEQTFTSC